jgi:hypothetical protein
MPQFISGIVKNGQIEPTVPLPDGLTVQILVPEELTLGPELAAELEAWQMAGAESIELIERLAEAEGADAER